MAESSISAPGTARPATMAPVTSGGSRSASNAEAATPYAARRSTAVNEEDGAADQIRHRSSGRGQGSLEISHHLGSLTSDVVGADQRATGVHGVLTADIDGGDPRMGSPQRG